ncbi:MAG: lipopolysaccharide heptosyltransferase II [Candidatus Goldbacteria bacterium]|nr:lipopolysaccharide heptosyltransferase II [Candidatus Goldiibacteriota bacterium]
MKISAVVITFNEEKNVERCLKSLDFVNEIIIVDSFSTDNTLKIASRYTKKTFSKKFTGFSETKQFGIDKAGGDWILVIDADEEVSVDLKKKLLQIANENNSSDGYYIKRETFFLGRKIRHCGWGNDYQLRFFKKQKGKYDGKIVHESIKVNGTTNRIEAPLFHYSYPDSRTYFEKMNRYTSLQAVRNKKRFLYLNLFFNPFFKFFKMYFLKFGFLDGMQGFILSLYSGFSEFVKSAKMIEHKNDEMRNGLIIRAPNWIGDAVISTAFLKEAKRVYNRLYVLSDVRVKDVFMNNPYVDELMVFDKKNFSDNLKIISKIKKHGIKTGITLTPSFSSSLIFFLSGVKKRAGYYRDGILLNLKHKPDNKHTIHISQEYKRIFYLISTRFEFKDVKQEIFTDLKEEKETLSAFDLNKRHFNVVIAPFVQYGPAKMWNIDKYDVLIDRLKQKIRNVKIFIIGTEEDKKYDLKNDYKITDLRGRTTIRQIIHVIKNSDLFIGNDSGMMHIADAFNKRSVVIFGSTSPVWTGPLSKNSKVVKVNLKCSPCFDRECRYKTYECLEQITVEMVLKEINKIIKNNGSIVHPKR